MKATCLALAALFSAPLCLAAAPDGAALYRDNCSQCHGERGMGGTVQMSAMSRTGGGMMDVPAAPPAKGPGKIPVPGPKLVGAIAHWPPEVFAHAVLKGVDGDGMPLSGEMQHWGASGFSADHGRLPTKAQVEAIQKYLQVQE